MPERKVVLGSARYRDGRGAWRLARRGDVLELSDEEAERLEGLGAVDAVDAPEPAGPVDPRDLSDEELIEWVGDHTVDEVVSHASDIEIANRLLAAENEGRDDPRVGVLRGIESVLSRAE